MRKGERQRKNYGERERAREIEIKTTETQDARKRKRQRVQCDTCCTHKYSVARGYRTPLITRPDSTTSHVFICQKTKYFLGRRQLQGKRACGVSPVIKLQQAHHSTAFLSLTGWPRSLSFLILVLRKYYFWSNFLDERQKGWSGRAVAGLRGSGRGGARLNFGW